VAIGREEKIRKITAEMLPDNYAMQKVCERLGFRLERLAEEGVVRAQIELL
jgi:acetyltransferase